MNTEITPIPEVDSRLSNINRFYETQYENTTTVMRQNKAVYCILNDTAIKTPTMGTSGTYVFDTMQESGGFTLVSNQVNVPKDGRYYVGCMINWYQISLGVVKIRLEPTGQESGCIILHARDNYGYSTLGMSNIVKLTKNQKIYITYTIQSAYDGTSNVYTVGDYTQNKLMIFEIPYLSVK